MLKVLHKFIGQRGILAPWHDVVVKNIAVGEQHATVAQIKMMHFGKIGIVIAGDELHWRGALLREILKIGAALFDRIRIGLGAGICRIAVAYQTSGLISERR